MPIPYAAGLASPSPLESHGWDREPVPFFDAIGASFSQVKDIHNMGARDEGWRQAMWDRDYAVTRATGTRITPADNVMYNLDGRRSALDQMSGGMAFDRYAAGQMDDPAYESKLEELRKRFPSQMAAIPTRDQLRAKYAAELTAKEQRGAEAMHDHPVAGFIGGSAGSLFDPGMVAALMVTGPLAAGRGLVARGAIAAATFGGASAAEVPEKMAESRRYGGPEYTLKEGMTDVAMNAAMGPLSELGFAGIGRLWRAVKPRAAGLIPGAALASDTERAAAQALEREALGEQAIGSDHNGSDLEAAVMALEQQAPKPVVEPEKSLEELFPDPLPSPVELPDVTVAPRGELPAEPVAAVAPETTPREDGLQFPDQAHADLHDLGRDLAQGSLKVTSAEAKARAAALANELGPFMDAGGTMPTPRATMKAARAYYDQTATTGVGMSVVDESRAADYFARGGDGPAPPSPVAPTVDRGAQPVATVTYRGRDIHATRVDADHVQTAPEVFQYKGDGDAHGVTSRLRGVNAWDSLSSGKAIVWEDVHGQRYVADGHQRLGLAKRLRADGHGPVHLDAYLLREADGWSAPEVRTLAALKNIREGGGTPLDAAKVFRDDPALMRDDSLPVSGEFIAQARGLAKLSDAAFGAVVNKVIPENYAAAIGRLAADAPELHEGLVKLLHQAEPSNLGEAEAIIKESLLDDWRKSEGNTVDLFGEAPPESTLIARGKIKAAIARVLKGDAKVFGQLVRHADAIEAGGNALARSASEAEAGLANAALEIISKMAMRKGSLGDAMAEAAERVTAGEATAGDVAKSLARSIKAELAKGVKLDELRATSIDPQPPTPAALERLNGFDNPNGPGQQAQLIPKPEEAKFEAALDQPATEAGGAPEHDPNTLALFDDLPAVGDHEALAQRLTPCAPGGAV